jgi:putative addiction module component (TIGR02574 family)
MAAPSLSALLKLSASDRAELALALWATLSPDEKATELELTPELADELDRRWEEHLEHPDDAIPWEAVRDKLNAE